MARLLSPDDACISVDVPFGRAKRYDGRSIEVSDPVHARALKQAGYTMADAGGRPSKSAGFECLSCGFHSFFKLCSRCGGSCERPDLVA